MPFERLCLSLFLLLSVQPAFSENSFFQFPIDQDALSGAPNFSFLNHPLQPADRLLVNAGHFCRLGEGKVAPKAAKLRRGKARAASPIATCNRVRLFGVNLAFGANFPSEADASRIARRLSKLGVNLVRLHHMDSSPDSNPSNAGSILTTGPFPTLNPVSVARLRTFLDALKVEGIYADLNLHVGYTFRPSVDQVPRVSDTLAMPSQSKPLHIFYPRMVQLQADFARNLIEALALRDDPVLGVIELDNETSLLHAWQTGGLDRYLLGEYGSEFQRQWNQFLRNKYRVTKALRQAWGPSLRQAARRGLNDGERIEDGSVALVGEDEVSVIPRANDYLLFLADRDADYFRRILGAVRVAAGNVAPVAGTQMGYGGLLDLDSHAQLDYQDNHFYVDHYNFPHVRWDSRDWRIRDASAVSLGLGAFQNMAAARQADRPYTVSEFNQPWPNTHAAEIDVALSAFGAFQDWDAIMHFAYSHGRNWDDNVPNGFNVNGDWTKFPNIGQAAWLFRSGVIRSGLQPVEITVPQELRLQAGREKRGGNISGFLADRVGYDPAIAFVHPVRLRRSDARVSRRATRTTLDSDTAELTYDRGRRLFLIHAAQAAGVIGFVMKDTAAAGAIDVAMGSSARGFASILLNSLDGLPIADSNHLLLSTPGYTLRSQPGVDPPRLQGLLNYSGTTDWWTLEPDQSFPAKPSGNLNGGIRPVWMERVESYVTVRTSAIRLRVYPLDGAGARVTPLADSDIERLPDGFRIHLQGDGQTFSPWYELVGSR